MRLIPGRDTLSLVEVAIKGMRLSSWIDLVEIPWTVCTDVDEQAVGVGEAFVLRMVPSFGSSFLLSFFALAMFSHLAGHV